MGDRLTPISIQLAPERLDILDPTFGKFGECTVAELLIVFSHAAHVGIGYNPHTHRLNVYGKPNSRLASAIDRHGESIGRHMKHWHMGIEE